MRPWVIERTVDFQFLGSLIIGFLNSLIFEFLNFDFITGAFNLILFWSRPGHLFRQSAPRFSAGVTEIMILQ